VSVPARAAALCAALVLPILADAAEPATYTVRQLTEETALRAAQAAIASCRRSGYQVAVAVVDRAGVAQVVLRDRFAGAHTIEVSMGKAWTAASTRTSTAEIQRMTAPGEKLSGLRNVPRIVALAGGLPIEAGGSVLGAIGVSGAPGGEADEACAKAGIAAIADELEF
jgi:uncharacterized protein GlcG (DUF336 family)